MHVKMHMTTFASQNLIWQLACNVEFAVRESLNIPYNVIYQYPNLSNTYM
jgi:hypothetical protein